LIVNHVVVRYLYSHESLERLVEGDEDVLIEDGEIHTERMRRELITEGELLSAARKQGSRAWRTSTARRSSLAGRSCFLERSRRSMSGATRNSTGNWTNCA
jgi:hypothetical protein